MIVPLPCCRQLLRPHKTQRSNSTSMSIIHQCPGTQLLRTSPIVPVGTAMTTSTGRMASGLLRPWLIPRSRVRIVSPSLFLYLRPHLPLILAIMVVPVKILVVIKVDYLSLISYLCGY
jgi:hypothetical protein